MSAKERSPDIPWEEARELLSRVPEPPEVIAGLEAGGFHDALSEQWNEMMLDALAPEVEVKARLPVGFFVDMDTESWDEVIEFYKVHYASLREASALAATYSDRIVRMRLVDRDVRVKHWPEGKLDADGIRARVAADGVSRFFHGVTPENLLETFREAVTSELDQFWPAPRHVLFNVNALTVVGVSREGDTPFVRFDAHFDTGCVHAYPVSAGEVGEDPHVLSSDVLQGYVRV